MKIIFFQIIFILVFIKEGTFALESYDEFKRIIDGKAINITDAPYQVSLQRYFKHSCGGALVNAYFIITAAHCLLHIKQRDWVSEYDLTIRLGTSMAGLNGIIRSVHLVRTPKNFNFSPPKNDIGIVKLRKAIKQSQSIKPIALNGRLPKSGEIGSISGYGSQHISYFRAPPHTLMMANVEIFQKQDCVSIMEDLGFKISPDMICAGFKDGHRDACQGDSGGPLTINGSLAGVISWGLGCGVFGRPGIYTAISFQLKWIQKCLKSIATGNKKC